MIKVISGGQTGVDQAALYAAEENGLPTGGTAPLGWLTQDGPCQSLGTRFNLIESQHRGYRERTIENVRSSDATIRIARNFGSAGERLTMNAIRKLNKPFLDIRESDFDISEERLLRFLQLGQYNVLNVAGNSELTAPGIFKTSKLFLTSVLRRYIS